MKRTPVLAALALLAGFAAAPAAAQSVGYATGLPGRDPAGDDEFGWGPAYRPETSFAQPGTPITPGEIAGRAYRARTGHGPYDGVQAPLATGSLGPYGGAAFREPGYLPPRRSARRAHRGPRGRTALRREQR